MLVLNTMNAIYIKLDFVSVYSQRNTNNINNGPSSGPFEHPQNQHQSLNLPLNQIYCYNNRQSVLAFEKEQRRWDGRSLSSKTKGFLIDGLSSRVALFYQSKSRFFEARMQEPEPAGALTISSQPSLSLPSKFMIIVTITSMIILSSIRTINAFL